MLAEIEAGRTHQIADVFDEQNIDRAEIERVQRVMQHMRVEVAGLAGGDLYGGHAFRSHAPSIILSLEIAFDDSDAKPAADGIDGGLQQAGLPRSGRRHQIDGEDTTTVKMLAIVRRLMIVLAQDAGQHFDRPLADGLSRVGAGVIGHMDTFRRHCASTLLAHGRFPRPFNSAGRSRRTRTACEFHACQQ